MVSREKGRNVLRGGWGSVETGGVQRDNMQNIQRQMASTTLNTRKHSYSTLGQRIPIGQVKGHVHSHKSDYVLTFNGNQCNLYYIYLQYINIYIYNI